MRYGILAVAFVVLIAGCGDSGSTQYSGTTPSAQEVYGPCAQCHDGTAERMLTRGGHHDLSIKCDACHEDLRPNDPGPGHRAIPACADCHTQQASHHDTTTPAQQCLTCHTPHGSTNLLLVRQRLTIPSGTRKEVTFTNLEGKADGSYASRSNPGTGLCEACHTSTRYYRSDGSGSAHFEFPCQTCHTHDNGFAPR